MPVSPATCRLAITPPVGPETSIWIGASAAASSVISPPLERMTTVWAATAASSSRRRIARRRPRDDRLEIGVGERGRGALVLLPLRQDLVGDRERQARQLLGQDRLHRLLVGRVEVGEQQADGDRRDLRLGRGSRPRPRAPRPGRAARDDRAIGVDALVELEAVAALDQRLGLDPAHVVVGLAVAALDERHVAKALGGDVGDDGTLALQHGVGRDRGAEADVLDGGVDRDSAASPRRMPTTGSAGTDSSFQTSIRRSAPS